MTTKTIPFDAAEYLTSTEDHAELLSDALAEGDAAYIAAALGTIARARGIARVAEETGLSRQALHKALGKRGNPTLSTILKVLGTLDLELHARVRQPEAA
ncbi:addiction module antidote protein [Sphingomonas parapaucimobilis]|uniref:Putative addiction module antidote protein n=1 Tax=Sphingomonas parapaucimobilis NBRC 15100 TaxID=1219049 RepID=A0A0A1W530_9SPHN|nr:addiction module antidote protein [Sphingomonas parapaucimobilis]GAM00545.1 putative addiction module antidote protein [Sphingomonas parapaucimobilis NBRC 15100]